MTKRKARARLPVKKDGVKDNPEEPWAGTVLFRGPKKSVKKAIAYLERLEERGQLIEVKRADGPASDMKGFLERQSRNLIDNKPDKDDGDGSKA